MRDSLDVGDVAALEAALSLFNDFDDEDGDKWIFGTEASEGQADNNNDCLSRGLSETVTSPTRKRVRKRQRYRQKDEITYLRARVTELEAELNATTQRIATARGIAPRDVEVISIWEELATRQQRRSVASALENARLRAILENQVQVAKELLRFVEMQPREEDIPGLRALKRLQIGTVDVMHVDHEELLRLMDEQYARTAAVFAPENPWAQRRNVQTVHVRDDSDSDTVIVEISIAWVVPFDVHLVAKILRERCDHSSIQARTPNFDTLEEKDRLLVSLFTGAPQNHSAESLTFRGRVVSRYYPEPEAGRVVIVSDLNVEPVDPSKSPVPAYAVQSQGWIKLQPYRPDGQSIRSDTTQHLTQIQWFRTVQIVPRFLGVSNQQHSTGAFTELVLSHINEDLDESQQVIEDLLLQDDRENATAESVSSTPSAGSSNQQEDV